MVKIEKDLYPGYLKKLECIGELLTEYGFEIEKINHTYDIFEDGLALGSLTYFEPYIIIYGSVDTFLDFANILETKGYKVIIKYDD